MSKRQLPENLGVETLAIRAAELRTEEMSHSEALFLTSSFVYESAAQAAARFAARENDADRLNGVAIEGTSEAVSAILVELSQQRTQEDALAFAGLVLREGERKLAFVPQPRRAAALAVLRAPDVPSVLFESGFVTNLDDRARLTTAEGRTEYAAVLARAVRVYFARRSDAATSARASGE